MRNLRGQTAIVTGGAVRLGRALVDRLAREGADVCVHYGSSRAAAEETVRALRKLGVRATSVQADVNEPVSAAQHVCAHALREFGRIDVLINNAAIFARGSLLETDEVNWDRHLNINLKSPVFLCRELAKSLARDSRAHIVNIVDWRAERPGAGHLAYSVAKAGLVALTKALALELAPQVQVNAIAPGAILPAPGASREQFAALGRQAPLQRTGHPDDIADAVVYLLRSEFVTGEVLHVTGGQEL
jgi:NAD(P)-dependent dehydrogenase (short-subunit alcohol dehydrogenase family)